MIRDQEVRIVGLGVLASALMVVAGCNPASSGSGKGQTPVVKDNTPPNENQPVARPEAFKFLGDFLEALVTKKATPEMFTAAFKAHVARPKFGNDEHEKLGYDPERFARFLEKMSSLKFDDIELLPAANATFFGSIGNKAGKAENCLIRLAPVEGAAGWQVDWLHHATAIAPPYRDGDLSPAESGPRIAAIAFLATMLDSQFDLSEAIMTNRYKRDLAFSTTESNKKQGYDSALLQNLKLREWKGKSVEFSIQKQELAEGQESAEIRGELIDADMRTGRPYAMALTKQANGEWQVDRFEVK